MLKIKSNTNEFTIIFSEKIGKKINAEKFSIPALSFFQLQRRTFLFFYFSPLCFVFCFSPLLVSAVFFFFSVQHHFFCFFRRVALFFQPKTILSSTQNVFFSPKPFSVQPKNIFFSSAHTTVSASFSFCWLCFQHLLLFFFSSCLSFLPLATTYCPFSAQVFSSKPFSAASCLFI